MFWRSMSLVLALGLAMSLYQCDPRPLARCTSDADCEGSKRCVGNFCIAAQVKQDGTTGEDKGSGTPDASSAKDGVTAKDDAAARDDATAKDEATTPEQGQGSEASAPDARKPDSRPGSEPGVADKPTGTDAGSSCKTDDDCPPDYSCDASRNTCVKGCACPRNVDPVCGTDGMTYSNACVAACKRIKPACKGQCPCNSGGCKTHSDCPTGHTCVGGQCQKGCACPKVLRPVCGADGKTYDNDCFATCAGVKISCNTKCPCSSGGCAKNEDCKPGTNCDGGTCKPCICPQVFMPVCGSDGKTHSNSCVAACNRATVKCQGQCPCTSSKCKQDTDCKVGQVCNAKTGQCSACACPKILKPVCGADGKSYSNDCFARCAHVAVKCSGQCPCSSSGRCTKNEDCKPGTNCDGGTCKPCICPKILKPVCGSDGKTHSNSCIAACNRATVKCQGQCPCKAGCSKDTDCKVGQVCNTKTGQCSACACPRIYKPVCGADGKTYSNDCTAKCAHVAIKCQRACPCP